VFDTALAEQVDFVLLAGNLVHPHRAGPRGLTFLHEQFARLGERGISVYWATSETDCRGQWPVNIGWPSNVHLFSAHRVERFVHSRGREPICQIAGISVDGSAGPAPDVGGTGQRSRPVPADRLPSLTETEDRPAPFLDDFEGSAESLFTIGVVPNPLDPISLANSPVRYWALGGNANAATPLDLSNPQRIAHLVGSPQGRRPIEDGPHGCTLVEIDAESQFRLTSMPTDVVRWHHERVAVDAAIGRSELDHVLHERLQALIAATPDRALLIRWTLGGEGPLMANAHRTGLAAELISSLRTDYGIHSPPAWTTAVEIEAPALPDAWYEQETLVGDYLRAARSLEHSQGEPIGLQAYLSERQLAGALTGCGAIVEPATRRSILRQAAILGADLLQPDFAAIKEPSR
jgi:DNA repair protein SbcD/Mre11